MTDRPTLPDEDEVMHSITFAMTRAGALQIVAFMKSEAKKASPRWEANLAEEIWTAMRLVEIKESKMLPP